MIVGETTGVSYGAACPEGEWKGLFLAAIEGNYDPSRVHFTESLPYADFLHLLQLNQVHMYLTCDHVSLRAQLEPIGSDEHPMRHRGLHHCARAGSDPARPQRPARECLRSPSSG